ncbi:unnamed protein product [Paramecium octaurelia]|uniref:Uncharacterized protein n=1 Tax=Paramecium octaurelia TaxID=43137 RepID=A0A8S1WQY5_PAROT|nr:unnamed protein product [Paramecium octaurelia]
MTWSIEQSEKIENFCFFENLKNEKLQAKVNCDMDSVLKQFHRCLTILNRLKSQQMNKNKI